MAEVKKIKIYPRDYEVGEYIEFPMGPGKRQEPVIKGKGVPIWALVSYAAKWGLTAEEISALWVGEITPEEVKAALDFWKKYPETVEDKNPPDSAATADGPTWGGLQPDVCGSMQVESRRREGTMPSIRIFPDDFDLGKYVEFPTGPGKRQEPVIKGKGTPVWALVSYAIKDGKTPEEISRLWNGYITPEEVQGALDFWKAFPDWVKDNYPEWAEDKPSEE